MRNSYKCQRLYLLLLTVQGDLLRASGFQSSLPAVQSQAFVGPSGEPSQGALYYSLFSKLPVAAGSPNAALLDHDCCFSYECLESTGVVLQPKATNPVFEQVDSVYSASFGRRKSWLVPAQLLCGGMMLWARSEMDDWVGEDGGPPHVKTLTTYFLALYFIMATQVCE